MSRIEQIMTCLIEGGDPSKLPPRQSRFEEIMYSFLVAGTDPTSRTRIEEIIACIKSSEEYTEPTQGRLEAILKSMSKGEEYTEETYSRIEALFKEWANKAI